MDRRHHKFDYNWNDLDDNIWKLDEGGDVLNDQDNNDDGKMNEAMEISVNNNSQRGEISILKPRQEIETEQAVKEAFISQTKVDPVMALGLHEFRHIILLLQRSGTSLPEILNLVKVSEAWSKAVLKALDSQTELFYFDYSIYALSYYYDLLKTNNLQVDSFYKIPSAKPSEVITTMLPRTCSRSSVSIKSLSKTLTNVSKLIVFSGGNSDEGALLEGLAFHLESLVLMSMNANFAGPISIMARLKRLELYDVNVDDLNLALLRVVLGRLEHLVLANQFQNQTSPISLDTWSTLFGYLKPVQLKHLGLVGFTSFPWKELFEELPTGRKLAAGLTGLQLGIISLSDLKAIAKIFGESAETFKVSRLSSLNFETLADEKVKLETIFLTLASPLFPKLTDLRVRLGGNPENNKPQHLLTLPKLTSVTSFTLAAPPTVSLLSMPRLSSLLRHCLPNLRQVNLSDNSWVGGKENGISNAFEQELTEKLKSCSIKIVWSGDYHSSGVFPARLLNDGRARLPDRCQSAFCSVKPHYPECSCSRAQQEFEAMLQILEREDRDQEGQEEQAPVFPFSWRDHRHDERWTLNQQQQQKMLFESFLKPNQN